MREVMGANLVHIKFFYWFTMEYSVAHCGDQ